MFSFCFSLASKWSRNRIQFAFIEFMFSERIWMRFIVHPIRMNTFSVNFFYISAAPTVYSLTNCYFELVTVQWPILCRYFFVNCLTHFVYNICFFCVYFFFDKNKFSKQKFFGSTKTIRATCGKWCHENLLWTRKEQKSR